jgi:nickel-dependent lactate racemase
MSRARCPTKEFWSRCWPACTTAAFPEDKIAILIATGLHRPNEGEELEEMIGPSIKEKYRVVNHVARDASTQVALGEVPLGINGDAARVAINTAYLNSDLKITTGLIEPHLMAGYSGGRKLVCPGIASAETIMQFHSPPMIGHPKAHAGNIKENPVHAMSPRCRRARRGRFHLQRDAQRRTRNHGRFQRRS